MRNPQSAIRNQSPRGGFTLMELLIVITIIAILAGLVVSGLVGATNQARAARTRSIIEKIDLLLQEKYESYRTRPVPVRISAGTNAQVAAQIRLAALRDLMRMELPDRVSDVVDPPADINPVAGFTLFMQAPSVRNSYRRQAARNAGAAWDSGGWSDSAQGAECLYLILSTMKDGDKSALDYFSSEEIGDLDSDGMKEILDGWGRPILFLRWAPGYTVENGAVTLQTSDVTVAPDPFDPLRVDGPQFALYPLVMSSGLDREFDILTDNITAEGSLHQYCPVPASPPTDNNYPKPYVAIVAGQIGLPMDRNVDGVLSWMDNITNHYREGQ